MAYATVHFHHPQSGRLKTAPVGFSWTTFFFGGIPALLRGHWVAAVVMFLACFVTWGLASVVFAFFYNKWFVNHLVSEGFKVTGASHDLAMLGHRLGRTLPSESKSSAVEMAA